MPEAASNCLRQSLSRLPCHTLDILLSASDIPSSASNISECTCSHMRTCIRGGRNLKLERAGDLTAIPMWQWGSPLGLKVPGPSSR
eukprot:10324486-Karenia_brevis.AAC.1